MILATLDGKSVTKQERDYILALRHKKKVVKKEGKISVEDEKEGPHPLTTKSLSSKQMYGLH